MSEIPANHIAMHALGMCSQLPQCQMCQQLTAMEAETAAAHCTTEAELAELPPDPENMNDERAEFAADTLRHFTIHHGEHEGGNQQNLTDLLCNLAHFCDRHELDFAACLLAARRHYDAETDDFGTQFNGVMA